MNKIKKILACIDLSQYSLITFEYAVKLAKRTQAQIIVFNVINQLDLNSVNMVTGYFPGYFSNGTNSEEYVKGSFRHSLVPVVSVRDKIKFKREA
ncbi:MAG: universal stress protein [Desulfobacula sp.]|nr:universal stress protein [Desulfobacula sp.]